MGIENVIKHVFFFHWCLISYKLFLQKDQSIKFNSFNFHQWSWQYFQRQVAHRLQILINSIIQSPWIIAVSIFPMVSADIRPDRGFVAVVLGLVSFHCPLVEHQSICKFLSHSTITKPGQSTFCIVIRPCNIKMSGHISCSDFISINSVLYIFHH